MYLGMLKKIEKKLCSTYVDQRTGTESSHETSFLKLLHNIYIENIISIVSVVLHHLLFDSSSIFTEFDL